MDTQQRQLVKNMARKLPADAQMAHMYPEYCTRTAVISLHILQKVAGDGVAFVRAVAQSLGIKQELYQLDIRYYNATFRVNCQLIMDVGDTKFVISVCGMMYDCPTFKGVTTPHTLEVENFGWKVSLTSQELALY